MGHKGACANRKEAEALVQGITHMVTARKNDVLFAYPSIDALKYTTISFFGRAKTGVVRLSIMRNSAGTDHRPEALLILIPIPRSLESALADEKLHL